MRLPLYFRLFSAARDLYVSEGPEGFSIRRLAKRTGLSSAALYKWYPSRDAVLANIAGRAWNSFAQDLQRHEDIAPAAARFAERIEGALQACSPRKARGGWRGLRELPR
jgi:AcrR family transcriptional regulator